MKTHEEPAVGAPADAQSILALLAQRYSCRAFDGSHISPDILRDIVADGTQAPSSCNQQQWHFIIVTDPATKKRVCEIAGGNPHFADCSALIYLTFQKGWTHGNFSVVQSVAAAGYHMMLSAHLRGFSSIWNAGIGPHAPLRDLLDVPPIFELQGALAIGRPLDTAPPMKAPRRPSEDVMSFDRFLRPAPSIYPVKPAADYPFFKITNTSNPYARWNPREWRYDQLADFRGYSVWAKSPLADVYVSRRQADGLARELSLIGDLPRSARVAEIMPWGGTSTVGLRRRLPEDAQLLVTEMAAGNLSFIKERLRQEGLGERRTSMHVMGDGGALPFDSESLDAVVFFQSLEHSNDPVTLLAEAERTLKRGGTLVVTSRNLTSLYGLKWLRSESQGQIPNQGPFKPIPAFCLKAMVARNFRIAEEIGIGRRAGYDDDITHGPARFLRRVFGVAGRKR